MALLDDKLAEADSSGGRCPKLLATRIFVAVKADGIAILPLRP